MSGDSQFRIFPLISLCRPQNYRKYLHKQAIYTLCCLCWLSRGSEKRLGQQMCAKSTSAFCWLCPPLRGAGLGRSHPAYLDGGHLCVSSPAETLELQRVVAEAHGPAGWRGPFLQLKLQVVKVREIMVPHGSGEEKEHRYFYPEGKALDSPSSTPGPSSLLRC